ncbi:helix-turn-helix domain-containing protein [Methylobacterium sp. J-030]|uniref:helix-turn-helix domain-containing protein n=1 Tax=Methylobacterium sp. J-030 TaxID=2836627 RepID=UPI001FB8C571|nr:helix-turn-helix domain-containing protein [Methylobacterium sp. J-030]MCJ2073370.1 helix-turn-helix domain-containing protein [Methylobacterium sp. J-030]
MSVTRALQGQTAGRARATLGPALAIIQHQQETGQLGAFQEGRINTHEVRMSGWDRVIRRYRRMNGLTQAALGEVLGVEQATVSRWECGFHHPDLAMQKRLRSLLRHDFVASDDIIMHRVRNSLSAMKMAHMNGRNLAVSGKAATLHGVNREFLEGLEYRHLFTDVLGAQWQLAREAGFFRGEIASIHVYNTWRPACGGEIRYCEGFWTPTFLSDGQVMLTSEFADIEAAVYKQVPEDGRVTVVSVDDLFQ